MPWPFWRGGRRTDAEIRLAGMNALIDVLGVIEAERFIAAVSRDRFNYTEWRRQGLPHMDLDELARQRVGCNARWLLRPTRAILDWRGGFSRRGFFRD